MNARLLLAATLAVAASALVGCDDKKSSTTTTAASAPAPSASALAAPASAPPPASASAPHDPPTHISAQHVLVAWKGAERAPKGVTRSKADAKKRADEVAKKAHEKGADFSALVAEYSDDPGAKERQGSLGKFAREKMAKSFSDAAFALEVDAVSEPVETPFGYHVIKRNQ